MGRLADAASSDVPLFDVPEARAVLADLLPTLDAVVALRADAAELTAATRGGAYTSLGGLPELKAAQARLDELVTTIQARGAQLKGLAPLLLDFPAELDGVPVLLCWLEGDRELQWYHRHDLGLPGRRRLPDSPAATPPEPGL
jgi:arsenite methyltransferase